MLEGVLIAYAIAILSYVLLQFAFLPYLQKWDSQSRLMKKGLEAYAVVLNIQPTGNYIGNLPQVCMLVKVQPFTGRNFVAETKQAVSLVELSKLRPGSFLKVKYNPNNVKEVTIIK